MAWLRLFRVFFVVCSTLVLTVAQPVSAPSTEASVIRMLVGLTGEDVLDQSIKYHDPSGVWSNTQHSFRLFESRPGNEPEDGGNYRITDVKIDIQASLFRIDQQRGPDHIVREVDSETCRHRLNSLDRFSESDREAFSLDCTTSKWMRDYYIYLWGLPMKLKDPGTQIHPEVQLANFFGKELLQIRVTYDADVGGDTWYFYFDQDTFALRGYRFYHDEAVNDGEYILLDGETAVDDLIIPMSRKWYTHKEGRYLGEDRIINN